MSGSAIVNTVSRRDFTLSIKDVSHESVVADALDRSIEVSYNKSAAKNALRAFHCMDVVDAHGQKKYPSDVPTQDVGGPDVYHKLLKVETLGRILIYELHVRPFNKARYFETELSRLKQLHGSRTQSKSSNTVHECSFRCVLFAAQSNFRARYGGSVHNIRIDAFRHRVNFSPDVANLRKAGSINMRYVYLYGTTHTVWCYAIRQNSEEAFAATNDARRAWREATGLAESDQRSIDSLEKPPSFRQCSEEMKQTMVHGCMKCSHDLAFARLCDGPLASRKCPDCVMAVNVNSRGGIAHAVEAYCWADVLESERLEVKTVRIRGLKQAIQDHLATDFEGLLRNQWTSRATGKSYTMHNFCIHSW